MSISYWQPPDPTNGVLKRIYPWDHYDITMVLNWLYEQAKNTGFTGTFEDFKQRYGAYIEATEPEQIYDLIDNYTGPYRITPLVSMDQTLKTKNKIMNDNLIIEQIPEELINKYKKYKGSYTVIPMAQVDQQLRTENKVLEHNLIIEKIPYAEVSNLAGGKTVTIG